MFCASWLPLSRPKCDCVIANPIYLYKRSVIVLLPDTQIANTTLDVGSPVTLEEVPCPGVAEASSQVGACLLEEAFQVCIHLVGAYQALELQKPCPEVASPVGVVAYLEGPQWVLQVQAHHPLGGQLEEPLLVVWLPVQTFVALGASCQGPARQPHVQVQTIPGQEQQALPCLYPQPSPFLPLVQHFSHVMAAALLQEAALQAPMKLFLPPVG